LGTKEIWKAEVAASEESRNAVAQLSEALAGSDINEAAEQIKSLVGVSADIPQELAKRIFLLTFASIDPVCDLTTAGIIHEHFPTDFLNITQEILNISGLGSKKKESKSSGVTKKYDWKIPLFKVKPDWFPESFLTDTELELWIKFYEEREANRKQR
jgi:hypothetical protein